jgi:hypothetical protein
MASCHVKLIQGRSTHGKITHILYAVNLISNMSTSMVAPAASDAARASAAAIVAIIN